MGPGKGVRVSLEREGRAQLPADGNSRLPALDGMVGEVIMKDCCDIHSTDLPTGVSGRWKGAPRRAA